jgi:hypothetical protein
MMDLDLPMLALRQVHLLHLDLLVLESWELSECECNLWTESWELWGLRDESWDLFVMLWTFEQFSLIIRAVLHSFSLSGVSHKGEFYPERFLMRQHCTQLIYPFKSSPFAYDFLWLFGFLLRIWYLMRFW